MTLPPDSESLMRDYVAPMIRDLIRQYVEQPTKS
jgi:hypothetical protein